MISSDAVLLETKLVCYLLKAVCGLMRTKGKSRDFYQVVAPSKKPELLQFANNFPQAVYHVLTSSHNLTLFTEWSNGEWRLAIYCDDVER